MARERETGATRNERRHRDRLAESLPEEIRVEHLGGNRSDVADIMVASADGHWQTFCESKPRGQARCGQATYRPSGRATRGMEALEWDDGGMPVPSSRNAYTDALSAILVAHRHDARRAWDDWVLWLPEGEQAALAAAVAAHYRDDLSCSHMLVGSRNGDDVLIEVAAEELLRVLDLGIGLPYPKASGSRPLRASSAPGIADQLAQLGIPHGTLRLRRNLPVSRRDKSGLVLPVDAVLRLGWPLPSQGISPRATLAGRDYILSDTGGAPDFVELRRAGTTRRITVHAMCRRKRGVRPEGDGCLSPSAVASLLRLVMP